MISSTRRIGPDEALPELRDDDPLFMLDLPPEVVKNGKARIFPAQLPDNVKYPRVLTIFNVKFNDVGKIWFYINDKTLLMKRDRFQERMNAYYGCMTRLKMRIQNAVPGQYCAVNETKSWLRGEIVSKICKQNCVQVRLVDVGLTKVFHVSKICFLVNQFVEDRQHIFYGSLDFDDTQYNIIYNWYLSVGVICVNRKDGITKLKLLDGMEKANAKSSKHKRVSETIKRIALCEQAHFPKVAQWFAESIKGNNLNTKL